MNSIYLDNAATTQLRPEVIDCVTNVMRDSYGNASSTHSFGRSAKAILEQCRKNIAGFFNAHASEIVFTSGGTEADNLAILSAVRDLGVKTIITSKIEHHAVLHTVEQLASEFDVDLQFVDIDTQGQIDYEHLRQLVSTSENALVSLMHVNNEIGNILDIQLVSELCNEFDALFHSDMVQSVGHFKIDTEKTKIDFFAASAHKFHGPKGVGFCYIRRNSGLKAMILGGEQERGFRAGTESIHNIAGLEKALDMSYDALQNEKAYIQDLKRYFVESIKREIPTINFNGLSSDLDKSTYTLVNLRLPIDTSKGSLLQFQLDLKGIACSKGSACQSGATGQSHVLQAVLAEEDLKNPSLRFSFSIYNTKDELDTVISVLKDFIEV